MVFYLLKVHILSFPLLVSCAHGPNIYGIVPFPIKDFVLWHLIQHKMPTDESLRSQGCAMVYVYSLCES